MSMADSPSRLWNDCKDRFDAQRDSLKKTPPIQVVKRGLEHLDVKAVRKALRQSQAFVLHYVSHKPWQVEKFDYADYANGAYALWRECQQGPCSPLSSQ